MKTNLEQVKELLKEIVHLHSLRGHCEWSPNNWVLNRELNERYSKVLLVLEDSVKIVKMKTLFGYEYNNEYDLIKSLLVYTRNKYTRLNQELEELKLGLRTKKGRKLKPKKPEFGGGESYLARDLLLHFQYSYNTEKGLVLGTGIDRETYMLILRFMVHAYEELEVSEGEPYARKMLKKQRKLNKEILSEMKDEKLVIKKLRGEK